MQIFSSDVVLGEDAYQPFEGTKTTWHEGFERFDFMMDETTLEIQPFEAPEGEKYGVKEPPKGKRRCIVVAPKHAAPGHPWSWQGCYWDHEPQAEVELLRRGFHIAFITPDPGKQWDAWYAYLTEKHGLSKKPAFVGMSKGGVNAYDWATVNPGRVSCIYADNPAIRPDAFMKLGGLAANDVALLNICGSQDFLLQHHTLAIENRYQQLGGIITVMVKDGAAHHPHSLRNPKPIADWIERHLQSSGPGPRPGFANETFTKSYYYSLASTNVYLKEEDTYANCRGPGFTACYERYEAKTDSQWGIGGVTVIVPGKPAPGLPWVFRADAIDRDAAMDHALLARGFHIVMPPLTAQSGAVKEQWDAVYRLMTTNGFSKKAVMEGTRTAAGESYAWAIENPEKVACIVGHNPALRSLMSKKPVLDNLEPLAKAGVPLLHICDRFDPWFVPYTQALGKRYGELGGQLAQIINEGDPRLPLPPDAETKVIDFILEKTH
ncbi:MAG TPA: alpha/beta hydrolase [Candidatus Limnocylindria bacterium]|jgi:pimeloyl-ACP methyl ester carboxylesterase|nr:alpha/beta hydrolase [Candidatus Limnocylindria bacterium]